MELPTWAQPLNSTRESSQRNSLPMPKSQTMRQPKSLFPVHRIEDSPILANYQGGQMAGCDVTERGKGFPNFAQQTQQPLCKPEEVLFKVKKEYSTSKHNTWCPPGKHSDTGHVHKMLDLSPLDSQKEIVVESRDNKKNMLPTSTMVMEENPDQWYRKFSRNIHGLKKDKPYSNLTWPPVI